ncbi:uncharacterized protein BJ171DRAFT_528280 [Polychytrium aggregatum]|uniref:uncharacterized protein n=1 Tax=Polychytrium aggregatum TaxID=110093 RepID=UPI0022FDC764|nr:uncharacterized protein BJ171DRAFT_528280 [Polychytrium aggregatum]KAI9193428.1 hypothetical protein BJ171DRAFT_528280 [Polychytrium aggregatum]
MAAASPQYSILLVDYTSTRSTRTRTLVVFSSSATAAARVVIGDSAGCLRSFSWEGGRLEPRWTFQANAPIESVQRHTESSKVCILVRSAIIVLGLESGEFVETIETHMAEAVLHLACAKGPGIYHIAGDHYHEIIDSSRSIHHKPYGDRILDMLLLDLGDAEALAIAFENKLVQVMQGQSLLDVYLEHTATCLAELRHRDHAKFPGRFIVAGTAAGTIHCVHFTPEAYHQLWIIKSSEAVSVLTLADPTHEGSDSVLAIGYANGLVQCYSLALPDPVLLFATSLGESVTNLAIQEGNCFLPRLLATTFTGRIVGISCQNAPGSGADAKDQVTSQAVSALQGLIATIDFGDLVASDGSGGLHNQSLAPNTSLSGSVLSTQTNVLGVPTTTFHLTAETRSVPLVEALNGAPADGDASAVPTEPSDAKKDTNTMLIFDCQESLYTLSIEVSASFATLVILRADFELTVADEAEDTNALSISPIDKENRDQGNLFLATYRPPTKTRRLVFKVMPTENSHGVLSLYVAMENSKCRRFAFTFKPMSLHERISSIPGDERSVSFLSMSSELSLSELNSWLSLCFNGIPERPIQAHTDEVHYYFRCSYLPSFVTLVLRKGLLSVFSESALSLQVVKQFLISEAERRVQPVSFQCELNPDATLTVVRHLYQSIFECICALRQAMILEAIKELEIQEGQSLDLRQQLGVSGPVNPMAQAKIDSKISVAVDVFRAVMSLRGVRISQQDRQLSDYLHEMIEQSRNTARTSAFTLDRLMDWFR